MAKKTLVVALLVAVSVPMVAGCNASLWRSILQDAAVATAFEFVLDNDAIFDLFQDDFGTGALYNDRNTANPSRQEP
jgi:hypothetical protein